MKIDEASELLGLSKDTLRYYEKMGLIGSVPRNASGLRDYDSQTIKHIKFILCMRNAGLTLKQIKHYIELYEAGDETHEQRLNILLTQKEHVKLQIYELNETLDYLTKKIDIYNNSKR